MTASARTTRRRLAGLTAALTIALPLLTASPAHAVTRCGATKTVRVSIQYRACDSDDLSGHKVKGYAKIQNNHGDKVKIEFQDGYTVNGGPIVWNPNTPPGTTFTVPKGASNLAGWPGWVGCHQGNTIGYVFRVRDNNGAWGPGSFATPVTCP
jgi:hypothetical protein